MFARKWHCFSDDYEAVAHPITIEIAHGHLVLMQCHGSLKRRTAKSSPQTYFPSSLSLSLPTAS